MKEVQIVESLKYGARAFLYFIVSVILGGGGVALGLAVGYNAVTIFGTGGNPVIYDTPELLAGVVLVILGGTVLFTGLFGLLYKLLTDSVAAGYENTGSPEVGPESPTERREQATRTEPEPSTDHSETVAGRQPSAGQQTSSSQRTTATGQTTTKASAESVPQQSTANTEERVGNGDAEDESEHVHDTEESEQQIAAQPTGDVSRGETAGDSQTTTPTETEVTPQGTSEASDRKGTQRSGREAAAPDAPAESEKDADEWGPPGQGEQGEASSAESTATDTDQTRGEEPPDEQAKEQTAGEIAFGEREAATTDEQSGGSAESETDEDMPSDLYDLSEEDDTSEGGESSQREGDEEQSRANQDDKLSTGESASSGSDTEPQQQEETKEHDGDTEGEEPLVPEYDEIPNEEDATDTDSGNDDPLDDPLDGDG